MNARAMNLTAAGLVDAPTVRDFVAFVRAHPGNPYPNIGWGLTCANVSEDEDLAIVSRRLPRALATAKAQIRGRHWAANHTKVAVIEKLLSLIDEFEMGAA